MKKLLYILLTLSITPQTIKSDFRSLINQKATLFEYFSNFFTKKDNQTSLSKNNNETETKPDQIKNSLFWASFGDAFGNEVEFIKNIDDIMKKSGYNQDPLSHNYKILIETALNYAKKRSGNNFVDYTDDTRMSLLVIEALLENKNLKHIFVKIARLFKIDMKNKNGWNAGYRVPGVSTIKAIDNLAEIDQINDKNVLLSNKKFDDMQGGGCGSVMHAYPFGYIFDATKAKELSVLHARITHNHPISVSSCGALSWLISKLIHEKITKEEILNQILETIDTLEKEYVENDYALIKNNYKYRMKEIINAALEAAREMKVLREEIATRKNKDPYLISFYELMQYEEFRKKHLEFFSSTFSGDYTYDSKQFPGWDSATCFAAAVYNFSLWIPENHQEITDKKYAERCLSNALMSSVITGGDSDSIAGITGALCGAAFSVDSVPEVLKNVIEDSKLIEYYAQELSIKEIIN
jgi:ADP-ribosylglycohydrolase